MPDTPLLMWFRRDLRLTDNPALTRAAETGRPVIPVFVHDETVETMGAAPKWRMGLAVEHFAARLEGIGSRLILRRGQRGRGDPGACQRGRRGRGCLRGAV